MTVWSYFMEVFDLFPLSILLDRETFCIHGGLSPNIKTLHTIQQIKRDVEIPHEGAFSDLMWSDPDDVESWVDI